MNPSSLKMFGYSGMAYGLMAIIWFVGIIAIGAAAVSSAGNASSIGSVNIAGLILHVLFVLAFVWMLFNWASVVPAAGGHKAVTILCWVAIACLVVSTLLFYFLQPSAADIQEAIKKAGNSAAELRQAVGRAAATPLLIEGVISIILGIVLIVGASLSFRASSQLGGAFKGFLILMIIVGAFYCLMLLQFPRLVLPFLNLAAGIVLLVAMMGAAKRSGGAAT